MGRVMYIDDLEGGVLEAQLRFLLSPVPALTLNLLCTECRTYTGMGSAVGRTRSVMDVVQTIGRAALHCFLFRRVARHSGLAKSIRVFPLELSGSKRRGVCAHSAQPFRSETCRTIGRSCLRSVVFGVVNLVAAPRSLCSPSRREEVQCTATGAAGFASTMLTVSRHNSTRCRKVKLFDI